jgi:hypothetical protein
MGRPIYIWRLADLKATPPLKVTDSESLRIAKPTYQVWLSKDETTVRVVEKAHDSDTWHEVENYPAR